jgi:hypothetical protein
MRTFEQPRLRRTIGKAYYKWARLSYKFLRHIDTPLRHLHQRKCTDGCAWGYDNTNGTRIRLCGYMPLTNRQDFRAHDLSLKKRTYRGSSQTVSPEYAREHGFPRAGTGEYGKGC